MRGMFRRCRREFLCKRHAILAKVQEPVRVPLQEACDLGKSTGMGVEVVVVPAAELVYKVQTENTFLSRCSIA